VRLPQVVVRVAHPKVAMAVVHRQSWQWEFHRQWHRGRQ